MPRWKLFLDDERDPVRSDWIVARTSVEAIQAIIKFGMPIEIAFDHDLGGDDSAMILIQWLTDTILDGERTLDKDFTYSVHSQNPVGAENIKSKMDGLVLYCGGRR